MGSIYFNQKSNKLGEPTSSAEKRGGGGSVQHKLPTTANYESPPIIPQVLFVLTDGLTYQLFRGLWFIISEADVLSMF